MSNIRANAFYPVESHHETALIDCCDRKHQAGSGLGLLFSSEHFAGHFTSYSTHMKISQFIQFMKAAITF